MTREKIHIKQTPTILKHFFAIMWGEPRRSCINWQLLPRPWVEINMFGKNIHVGVWKRVKVKRDPNIPGTQYTNYS